MSTIKVSLIIPVLNSHEVVRRQLLHFQQIGLPDDTELIIVDDGSDPPLGFTADLPLTIHFTHDTRPWTWAPARNAGARIARGEYLLMTDVDHILSRDLIDRARTFGGQKMQFNREFGVLDEDGRFTQDLDVLKQYGLSLERIASRGVVLKPLPNNFAMRKDVFWQLGGYREDLVGRRYPQGEDSAFKRAWHKWQAAGLGQVHHERPTIYMFPNGQYCGDVDHNPFGLFHGLSRKTNANYVYRQQRRRTRRARS